MKPARILDIVIFVLLVFVFWKLAELMRCFK